MKFNFIKSFALAAVLTMAGSLVSCSNKDDDKDDTQMKAVAEQFVNGTVIPTYTQLANSSQQLVEALQTLKRQRTDANVQAACDVFLESRAWWEKSEAFLFGPAGDFGIDPHIDSWPLDENAFNTLMNDASMLTLLEGEDGDVAAGETFSSALLGFHGIEYILFEDGHAKSASKISDKDMIYAVAVAGDLRNRCYQLEVSWAGGNAVASHRARVEELELNHTVAGGSLSYGQNMMNAGNAGSTYSSWVGALQAICDGCKTIADEVGTSKIGKAHNGEDVTYVESPYSQQSLADFYDNILSINNVYMGGVAELNTRNADKSLHSIIADRNPDLDRKVTTTIVNALNTIKAMPAPFVNNYSDDAYDRAVEACQAIDEVFSEVISELAK